MKNNRLRFSVAIFIAALSFTKISAQSEYFTYGRQILDTLASDWTFGRGYMKEGDKKAAYIIATEFTKMKLKYFVPTPQYYHNVAYPVNAFTGDAYLAMDEHFLACGKDFIPRADCPTVIGEFPIEIIDSTVFYTPGSLEKLLAEDLTGTFVVIDDKGITGKENTDILDAIRYGALPVKAVADLKDKLTFSVATELAKYPVVEILRSSWRPETQTLRINIETVFVDSYPTQNVIGYVEGSEVRDSFFVFSAHYDHLGMIGNVMFHGANDNASGVAMMMSLAKYYSQPENQPKYTIVFIAFGGEEAGLLGSLELSNGKVFNLDRIKFMINMDIMGTGDEGITVVNATENPAQFDTLLKINEEYKYLSQIKSRGKAMNSDHYYFSEKGVPAIFMYTMGGIKAYHDIYDVRETLPLTEFEDIHAMLREYIVRLSGKKNK